MALPGTLSVADLSADTDTLLATITAPAIVNINLCNRNNVDVKVRIAIDPTGGATPGAAHWIEYDAPLGANQPLERGGKSVETGAKIWARTTLGSVSARVEGVPST